MKKYMVTLARTYAVSINAESEETALRKTELFVGTPKDISLNNDIDKESFDIKNIELIANDAVDVEINNE